MKIDIQQLEFVDIKLRNLLGWLESQLGMEPIITSQYRIGDKGVHGTLPLRGTDIRCRCKSVGQAIETMVNSEWIYDESRPEMTCCFLHGQGSNMHLHFQVHHNTRRKQR